MAGSSTAPAVEPANPEWQDDADLASVCFVDALQGWAVGDRGVIWHTTDSGRIWTKQHSGYTGRLESVFFLTPEIGWAVGGQAVPYTHRTSGLVLATTDGGRRWQVRSREILPALRRVKFFTPDEGYALGDSGGTSASGAVLTRDGGRTWRAVPGWSETGWAAGDLVDPLTGAMASPLGARAVLRRGGLEASDGPPLGLRRIHQLQLGRDGSGWLVGDGALVWQTRDFGLSWQVPPQPLPPGADELFDWHALATHENHCWIAGQPGSRVLHSADGGRTWEWSSTGQTLPLRSLHFADPQHGWAVGAHGTILATDDGGRTWRKQQAGGERAALLAIYCEPDEIPLEVVARYAGNDGYFTVAHLVGRRDLTPGLESECRRASRAQAALVQLGGCGVQESWRFPLPAPGLNWPVETLKQTWDRAHDGRGLQFLEAELVAQIRTWRPEVVLTSSPRPDPRRPLAHVLHQLVLRAVEMAEDPTRYPEQTTHAELAPWKVRKVFASLEPGTAADVNLDTAQLALRLGQSLADAASEVRGLTQSEPQPSPALWGFQLAVNRLPQGGAGNDLFSGLVLHPGTAARRPLPSLPAVQVQLLRRASQQRRNVEALVQRPELLPGGTPALLGQMQNLVRELPADLSGQVLFSLGQEFQRKGRFDLTAETYDLLLKQHADHPTAEVAAVWLMQYWASSELAWQAQRRQRVDVRQASVEQEPNSPAVQALGAPTALKLNQGVSPAFAEKLLDNRPERAAELGRWLQEHRPALFQEPTIRFPLAAAHTKQGYPVQADRFYLAFRQGRGEDAWWACAAGERWLSEAQGLPPKAVCNVFRTRVKPRLDGDLSETCWQEGHPAALRSAARDDDQWPALVWLAYDEEFLYLAVRCRRPPGRTAPAEAGPRKRDPNLENFDRVHLYLDLDRDWATYYHLVVDERGWVAEDCWGDASFNPNWFVAAAQEERDWCLEAALPWSELTGTPPRSRSTWALGVQRTVPGTGFQSWTQPAAPLVIPQGFGYLIFD